MKKRSVKKIIIVSVCSVTGLLICFIAALFIILQIRTNGILNDYSSVYQNEKYSTPLSIDNVEVIKQDVSCGYAVIEMFSSWCGAGITEETLYNEYGKVVTSTGQSFCDEMNKQFPSYKTVMYKYLTNTELIDKVYETLSKGIPVPFEWAAKYEGQWTLHYSLITGIDIPNDTVVIANPYGYSENITIKEFLERTSFEAYTDMPLFFRFAFALGIFEKNTVFAIDC